MAQVTLGKFFSGVPQKRKLDGDSKKIYEHKRKIGFIDSWSKINFLTNLSIRASANLFYLPETLNY
jgi:hypothetical protein